MCHLLTETHFPWGKRWLQEKQSISLGGQVRLTLGDPLSPLQELELVEDVWRGEAQDLLSQIAQLQEENKQLMTNLNHKEVGFSEEEFQKQEGEAPHPSTSHDHSEATSCPQSQVDSHPDSPRERNDFRPVHGY